MADKKGTQKYFDLTERVLADEDLQCDQNMTVEAFLEWYTERRIQSVGFLWNKSGGGWQGRFLSENDIRNSVLQTLLEKNKIDEIQIEGIEESFYLSKSFWEHMNYQTPNNYVRFIAPLDNMIWDRKMLEALFDFTYSWEVYTPVVKRKFGYYVLPVLYNGQFIARFEPEPIRETSELVIKNWWWEPEVEPTDDMKESIIKEFARFAEFLQVGNSAKNMIKLEV